MFDSGVKAKSLIDSIKFEADIALPIASSTYLEWLSALEQLIYSEIIREQKAVTLNGTHDIPIDLSEIQSGEFEAPVRYEDIYTVYADEEQLIQSTVTSGVIFRDTWYKTENNLGLNLSKTPETIKIIYFVRPAIKKGSGEEIPDIPVLFRLNFWTWYVPNFWAKRIKWPTKTDLLQNGSTNITLLCRHFRHGRSITKQILECR